MNDAPATCELEISGMHCAGCVANVEKALQDVPGVENAVVNFATERATVRFANGEVPAEKLVQAVRAAGYQARPRGGQAGEREPTAVADERTRHLRRQRSRLAVAVVLGLPVAAHHMLHATHLLPDALGFLGHPALQIPLTVAVLAIAAGPMMSGAARALLRRSANMDLLVSLGALTAFFSSLAGVATHTHELILFDATVMIVLFVGLGKYFEARARGHASAALGALLARLPRTALRLVDGQPTPTPIDAIRPGDLLRVPAQAPVPVDGEVVSGHAAIDEALLTGESMPVDRRPGEPVFGGTRVLNGVMDIRATATGADSAAARIGQLVEQAQAAKPPWQRFADRAAAVFVPVVLLLALATFAGWKLAGSETFWALQRTITVLVVACPCAMGLAIPTAVLVGTTRAAERGILVRDATALEAAGAVRTVLLDKTGTLTIGRPELARIQRLGELSEDDVLGLAAALERLSEHPLARAVVNAAETRGVHVPDATDLRTSAGFGLAATVQGRIVLVGSAAWLQENGIDTAHAHRAADKLAAEGLSVAWVAVDGRPAALLGFADPLHPEAAAAVARLRELGVRTRVLSGDQAPAVQRLAEALQIADYEAALRPADKLARVQELARRDGHVAMVGDGINDAPALAAAQVGIAIGTGADVAREAADICLVGHSPRLIAEAIRISRASGRVMKQNIFWAAIYNVIMIPVAVFTGLPPALATAAMMLSSLSVVGNSLRLQRIV